MKITKSQLRKIVKEELKILNEGSMMRPRARDMFGKTVHWRDLIKFRKVTKTGREKVDFKRVVNFGVIEGPSEDYPDGGLPGYRETGEALLRSDQPIIVTMKNGDRQRSKANGQEITLLDLLGDDEVKDLVDTGDIEQA